MKKLISLLLISLAISSTAAFATTCIATGNGDLVCGKLIIEY